MDSKAILTDMYNYFDMDKTGTLNLTEVLTGFVKMLELMGVKIKSDFKESVSSIAEMIRVSNSGETFLPKRIKFYFFFNCKIKKIKKNNFY